MVNNDHMVIIMVNNDMVNNETTSNDLIIFDTELNIIAVILAYDTVLP